MVVGHILDQVVRYLVFELRCWVPLDSELMDTLRAAISPSHLNRKTIIEFCYEHRGLPVYSKSHFLYSLFFDPRVPDVDRIICAFFYSKDHACEYYLGERKSYVHVSCPLNDRLIHIRFQQNPLHRLHHLSTTRTILWLPRHSQHQIQTRRSRIQKSSVRLRRS